MQDHSNVVRARPRNRTVTSRRHPDNYLWFTDLHHGSPGEVSGLVSLHRMRQPHWPEEMVHVRLPAIEAYDERPPGADGQVVLGGRHWEGLEPPPIVVVAVDAGVDRVLFVEFVRNVEAADATDPPRLASFGERQDFAACEDPLRSEVTVGLRHVELDLLPRGRLDVVEQLPGFARHPWSAPAWRRTAGCGRP